MTSVLYLERLCTSCKKRKSLVGGTSFPRFRCKDCRSKSHAKSVKKIVRQMGIGEVHEVK
jgi:hypothetical protein